MPDRSRKRTRDVNEIARQIVDEATGGDDVKREEPPAKDPAAVELGLKGGPPWSIGPWGLAGRGALRRFRRKGR